MKTDHIMDVGGNKERIITAAVTAAISDIGWVTCDRIEALTAGHGMLNIPVIAVANVLAEEVLGGASPEVKFADARRQPVDDLLSKAVETARSAGADGANAALISAVLVYMLGAEAHVGIPAGNRKLGATARMIAGVSRSGVAAIPTPKMNNKVSGFPAVQAIYQAMVTGKLSPVSGRDIPEGAGGGPLVGHSALGEDLIFPAMAENGARIGTEAMLDAMAGAGMPAHGLMAALLGTAAILEIIHPDADVADEYGPYGKVTSAELAGRSAAKTAGLPESLHILVTGEEYQTGKFVGDLGLILKDIGAPSVIGMMALDEILAVFGEGVGGCGAGPVNPPLGHIAADAVIALKVLACREGDRDDVSEGLADYKKETSLDPEIALFSMNTVARKAGEVRRGPVTDTLIKASEPARINALYRRAAGTLAGLGAGKSLQDIVQELEEERQVNVEVRAGETLSRELGKEVKIKVSRLRAGARRKGRAAKRYFAFDAMIDVDLTVDGKKTVLKGVVHDLLPKIALGERKDIAWTIPLVAPVISELYLSANTIINVTVPAAVAAATGTLSCKEAASTAAKAATITAGIPGARSRAEKVALLAKRIIGEV